MSLADDDIARPRQRGKSSRLVYTEQSGGPGTADGRLEEWNEEAGSLAASGSLILITARNN